MLKVEFLSGGYNGIDVLKNVSFEVDKGEILGVLGPNGSGKSTLLKMISGILPIGGGEVLLNEKPLADYTKKDLARKMAVLPQLHEHAFSYSVRETVSLGRYPYQTGWFSSWSKDDESAVREAMEVMGVEEFEDLPIDRLSGGERQRVFVAQALAQQAPLLLLDEPTNHLDIAHQKHLLDTIRQEVDSRGMTVVSIFHDINLASLYCDRLLLIENGEVKIVGEPHRVVKEDQIGSAYEVKIGTHPHPEQPKPQVTLLPDMSLAGNKNVKRDMFQASERFVTLHSEFPLKTVSSAVLNPGSGWFRNFINRHVEGTYDHSNPRKEMIEFLEAHGYPETDTVAMMTAVKTDEAIISEYEGSFGKLFVIVTAGIGHAVDVSEAYRHNETPGVGTINTWVIINGRLSDEAFIQAMITATEAKTKALVAEGVKDPITGTLATGTSTDSLLVAATQAGVELPFAGPATELGKLIGRGVFECTVKAIRLNK
ncbi:adenosylcobinamide amidohydrolase [Chungangia koreensis]|uniref:Adenosylcobinamide amidohydrolase n=1 Tax=Chungangia koreensis TaxID=752657 RepID=A0ABV8X437_9LACT